MDDTLAVVEVDRLALRFEHRRWPFAEARRVEIDRHFAAESARRPDLWNGRVLLFHQIDIANAVLTGACLETDYASFLAWRDWGFPDPTVQNGFAMAALKSVDGAFLMGVMGSHTSNAGKVYFASGTPEPADVVGGMVDLEASALRELAEEMGLGPADVEMAPGWTAVVDRKRVALMKSMQARQTADVLRQRMLAHLAAEARPELVDIRIIRPGGRRDPAIVPVVGAFLDHSWR